MKTLLKALGALGVVLLFVAYEILMSNWITTGNHYQPNDHLKVQTKDTISYQEDAILNAGACSELTLECNGTYLKAIKAEVPLTSNCADTFVEIVDAPIVAGSCTIVDGGGEVSLNVSSTSTISTTGQYVTFGFFTIVGVVVGFFIILWILFG